MLGQLKHKFFSLQEEITASVVKNLASSTPDPSTLNVVGGLDAGEELLDYWQIQWEAIHLAQDQNGRSAARCDRTISGIQQRIQKQWQMAIQLQTLVAQLPKINQDIEGIMKTLGSMESMFSDVEISLMALEDTIGARELQERQLDQRFQLAIYQERRKAEFNELASRLQSEYQKKKAEFDRQQLLMSQEKARESQQRFEADVRNFKASGRVPQPTASIEDADATLESVDLSEEDGHETLEAFLTEEPESSEASFFGHADEHLESGLHRSRTSSSGDSTSTEKESAADARPDTLDVGNGLGTSSAGPMSRAESIYYTPDATSDQLEELSLN